MSPLTRLARLPGQILWSVHMGNCSPVDRDEIQETKPKWCIVRDCRSFLDSCDLTNKANPIIPKVEIHTRQKLCHFGECKVILSKKFRPGHPSWSVHMGKFSSRLTRSRSQKPRSR